MSTKHKYYDAIVAWANGEKIQHNHCNEGWVDYVFIDDVPGFSNKDTEWRVKPRTITKRYHMALHSDGSVAAYDVTNASIYSLIEYDIKGFLKWIGDVVQVQVEV